ncbi:MAG: alpha/beta hydrolase [Leptolyngbyaceae cyanobacterium T60_A2020_046]|nr:alpha/beta hydrolase [Leptolyngbyaceae cyanobacterium T60_A2020_046]
MSQVWDWLQRISMGWGGAIALGSAIASGGAPAIAAERLVIQLGAIETTVEVADIETFATTGATPERFARYERFLTPAVQASLNNRLSLDPAVRDRFMADLTASPKGQQVLDLFAKIAPQLPPETLIDTIHAAAQDPDGLTALSLLRAIPTEELTIRGGVLMAFLWQLGLAQLEQATLSRVLTVEMWQPVRRMSRDVDPAAEGPQRVRHWSLNLRDRARDRTIPADLYWSNDPKGPVVVLSHGYAADRRFLAYMGKHLASHGIAVIAVEHPGSNVEALSDDSATILPTQEFLERPRDISFVLDRVSELNQISERLRGRLNLDQVTLVGHSLGGFTGLVMAGAQINPSALADYCTTLSPSQLAPADWLQCAATEVNWPSDLDSLRDDRIARLVLMNPLVGEFFGDTGLSHVQVPTMMLTSTNDSVTPMTTQQLRPFEQLPNAQALIVVVGGTHLSVGDPSNINAALTQIPFMPELPAEETERLRQYLNGMVMSFAMQETPQAARYRPFLSAAYAQEFSTPLVPLRYREQLPQNIARWLRLSDRLDYYLAEPWPLVASLLHLELIDMQHQLVALQRNAIARLPFSLPLWGYLHTAPSFYLAAAAIALL